MVTIERNIHIKTYSEWTQKQSGKQSTAEFVCSTNQSDAYTNSNITDTKLDTTCGAE